MYNKIPYLIKIKQCGVNYFTKHTSLKILNSK